MENKQLNTSFYCYAKTMPDKKPHLWSLGEIL